MLVLIRFVKKMPQNIPDELWELAKEYSFRYRWVSSKDFTTDIMVWEVMTIGVITFHEMNLFGLIIPSHSLPLLNTKFALQILIYFSPGVDVAGEVVNWETFSTEDNAESPITICPCLDKNQTLLTFKRKLTQKPHGIIVAISSSQEFREEIKYIVEKI